MYNQTYQEYIRNILGYPTNRSIYDFDESTQYLNHSNYNQNVFEDTSELEQYYPEIYNNIYPKVRDCCLRNTNQLNQTLLDNMVDEIYNSIETNEVTITNNVRNTSTNKIQNRTSTVENRQRPNNNTLRDLIRILILRELTGRPGIPPRPKPPFIRPPQSRPFM